MAVHHSVLFTGGLDSTYCLFQLASDEQAVVQPIYLMFPDDGNSRFVRPELAREMQAQDLVLNILSSSPFTKASFLPIHRIFRDEIFLNADILSLERPLAELQLGWQYLYFAALRQWIPHLELCHEDYMNPSLLDKLFFVKDGSSFKVDTKRSHPVLSFIFEDIDFPIFGTSRTQMISDISSSVYSSLLSYIFFCYKSVDGQPCGYCDNCRGKIEQGLAFYFPKESIHRYLVHFFLKDIMFSDFLEAFDLYVHHKQKPTFAIVNNPRMLRLFHRIEQIDKLSSFDLKQKIINGTLEFGCRTSKRQRILNYKKDVSRKHMLDYLGDLK